MAYIGDVCEEMSRRLQFLAKNENEMKSMTFEDVDGEYVAAFDDKGTTVRGIILDGVMHTSTGPNLKCKDLRLVQRNIEHSYRGFINEMTKRAQKLEDVARYIELGLDQCTNFDRFILHRDFLQAMFNEDVGSGYIYWFDVENDEIRFDRYEDVSLSDIGEYVLVHMSAQMLLSSIIWRVLKNVNVGFSFEKRDFSGGILEDDYIVLKDGRGFVSHTHATYDNPSDDGVFSLGDGLCLITNHIDSVYRLTQKPDIPTEPGIYQSMNGNIWVVESDSGMAAGIYESEHKHWHGDDATYEGLPPEEWPYKRIEMK